jgi:hypothetical protein
MLSASTKIINRANNAGNTGRCFWFKKFIAVDFLVTLKVDNSLPLGNGGNPLF